MSVRKIVGLYLLFMCFLASSIVLAESPQIYINKELGFQMQQPQEWYITESTELIKQLQEKGQYQKIEFIKNSGLIVTFTKLPFTNSAGFNPNITVSSQKIQLAVQPTKKQFLIYAKKILLTLAPEGTDLPIAETEVNDTIEMQASYEYNMANGEKSVTVVALTTIISDLKSSNYFVIVASCLKEDAEALKDMLKQSVESFSIFSDQ